MKVVGILGAMQKEIDMLLEKFKPDTYMEVAGLTFYVSYFGGLTIVIVECKIGKVNSALCTQILISQFGVNSVINVGVAGSIDSKIVLGDIVIATHTVQHDYDLKSFGHAVGQIPSVGQYFKCDEALVKIALKAVQDVDNVNIFTGIIASGDGFIDSKEKVIEIEYLFHSIAVEMEGGAIGHVCKVNNIPYIVIRSISDNANDDASWEFQKFMPIAAKNASLIVGKMVNELADETPEHKCG